MDPSMDWLAMRSAAYRLLRTDAGLLDPLPKKGNRKVLTNPVTAFCIRQTLRYDNWQFHFISQQKRLHEGQQTLYIHW
jgi:hypothetical protein